MSRPDRPTRRTLLTRGATALAVVAASPVLARLGGCTATPGASSDGSGRVQIALADFPALEEVDGFEMISVEDTGQLLAVIRVDGSGDAPFVVLDGHCTHAGCRVDTYDRADQRLYCACHGSEFELDGSVWSGPAVMPLPVYDYSFDGETLDVDLEPV